MANKTEEREGQPQEEAINQLPKFAFDWSEDAKEKSFVAAIYVAVGIPLQTICDELHLMEIEVKRLQLVARVQSNQPIDGLCAELSVTPEQVLELRRDCTLMNGLQVLTKVRGGEFTAKDASYVARLAEPTKAMFGIKDAGYLSFQQEFGVHAFGEKKRILNALRSRTESAEVVARIDQYLQLIERQLQQLEHARAAMTRAIEQATPPKADEVMQRLAQEGNIISDDVKQGLENLVVELEEANVSSKVRGFGTNIDVSDVKQIDAILAMPANKQCEALIAASAMMQAKSAGITRSKFSEGMRQLILKLYKRPLPLNRAQVSTFIKRATELHRTSCTLASTGVLGIIERFAREQELGPQIAQDVQNYIAALAKGPNYTITGRASPDSNDKTTMHKLKMMLACANSAETLIPIEPKEAWSDQAIADLKSLDASKRDDWMKLIKHCSESKSTKPSATWLRTAEKLVSEVGEDDFVAHIERWFALIPKKGTRNTHYEAMWNPDPAEIILPENVDILKGLAWCCSRRTEPRLVSALGDAAEACFKKVKNLGPRCPRLGNACVHALSEINTREAVTQLGRVQAKTKHASAQKQVEKALTNAAEHAGMTVDDLQDLSVPDFGMKEPGKLVQQFGDWRAEVVLDTANGVITNWICSSGKTQQSVPAQVKTEHADALKALKKLQTEVEKLLPSIRARIERSLIDQRHWRFDRWCERYLNHPVCATLARRLLWNFNGRTAIWHSGKLITQDGSELVPDQSAIVELWHPISCPPETVLYWRRWLAEHKIVQPFKQCHREIYVLTDAERQTAIYSHRFAHHILMQHQLQHVCRDRGWDYQLMGVFDKQSTPTLKLSRWDLIVEFWVEPVEEQELTGRGISTIVATDQVRFLRRGTTKPRATVPAQLVRAVEQINLEPVPLTEILPVVFSEIMRDVDLFVSICSIGTDPTLGQGTRADYWNRFSFGELNNIAQTRKQVLEQVIPVLKIAARWKLEDKFLVVQGDLNTYKIHLGSGNIRMEPNDEYLCIVPARGLAAPSDRVFLPFEGDTMLAVIISKAVMLSEDSKITDQSIVRQIRREK